MPATVGRTPFVGRQRESAALAAALGAALGGHGRIVLLAGEPGIGKSRLADECATRARQQGATVLLGRCGEGEGLPPYLPFVEALRAHLRTTSDEALRQQLGSTAPFVALLLPDLRTRLPDLALLPPTEQPDRYRLFDALCDLLLAIARQAPPGLLLLDDLHWADTPTLLLLQHLARRASEGPLLLGAYRTTDLARTHPLTDTLAELRRERLAERIPLSPLDESEGRALAEAVCGAPLAPAVAAAVQQETEGNPFFVEEVVQHLLAEGRDLSDSRAAVGEWRIPEGVREVIGRRLSRLSSEAQRLLQAAAVVGDELRFSVLVETAGGEAEALTEALEEVERAGILREERARYRFTHALLRQTVLEELSLPRRQRLHLRAAEALEQQPVRAAADIAALAQHLRQAGAAADPERALSAARAAAEAAAAVYAWEEAAALWQAALEAVEAGAVVTPRERCLVWLTLAEMQWRVFGDADWHQTYLTAAREASAASEPKLLAQAALGYAEVPIWGDLGTETIELLENALTLLGPDDSSLRTRCLGLLAETLIWSEGPVESAVELAAAGLLMARRLNDGPTLASALNEWCWAIGGNPARSSELEVAADELYALADAVHDGELRQKGRNWRYICMWRRGAFDEAAVMVEELAQYANVTRRSLFQNWLVRLQIRQALREGNLGISEMAATWRTQWTNSGWRYGRVLFSPSLPFAQARLLCRPNDALDQITEEMVRQPTVRIYGAAQALLLAECGRETEAQIELAGLAEFGFNGVPRNPNWLSTLCLLAELCAALHDAAHAAQLYPLLEPFSEMEGSYQFWMDTTAGVVARFLALLAATREDWEAAERHFEEALALNTDRSAPIATAHTARQWAEMLRARGRREDVGRLCELVEQAAAGYDALGLDAWAAKTRALLAAAPTTASAARPALPGGLSAREADVLRLIAAGQSNAVIATTLVLSVHTVERHIANIYAKIDAHGRADATAYALRRGLA